MSDEPTRPPPGAALDGDDWTFREIGEFIFWFSQAELSLRFALADALSLEAELIDPITASYDFLKLCDVTLAVYRSQCDDPEVIKLLESLVTRSKDVNNTQGPHSAWIVEPEYWWQHTFLALHVTT